jgi:uncharacterized DUF497 family protein
VIFGIPEPWSCQSRDERQSHHDFSLKKPKSKNSSYLTHAKPFRCQDTLTWDDRKEDENVRKHGVDFWEVQTVFFDPLAKQFIDSHPSSERFILIGHSARSRMILVVFAEKDGLEIRIISARKPTSSERKEYEEGI